MHARCLVTPGLAALPMLAGPLAARQAVLEVKRDQPGEGAAIAAARAEAQRKLIEGAPGVGRAVTAALDWLKKHQDRDGHWSAAQFMARDSEEKCDGAGEAGADLQVTALALLAFQADGNTLRAGAHRSVIQVAVKWLMEQQREGGQFGLATPGDQALATWAMGEAARLGEYRPIKHVVEQAGSFLLGQRLANGAFADGRGAADPVATALAMRAFLAVGMDREKDLSPTLQWLGVATDAGGRFAAAKPRVGKAAPETAIAAGVLARLLCGSKKDDSRVINGIEELQTRMPRWDAAAGTIDATCWLLGSEAVYRVGGPYWQLWWQKLGDALVKGQRSDGRFAGSWDPCGPGSAHGGRVWMTASLVLALTTPFRLVQSK